MNLNSNYFDQISRANHPHSAQFWPKMGSGALVPGGSTRAAEWDWVDYWMAEHNERMRGLVVSTVFEEIPWQVTEWRQKLRSMHEGWE